MPAEGCRNAQLERDDALAGPAVALQQSDRSSRDHGGHVPWARLDLHGPERVTSDGHVRKGPAGIGVTLDRVQLGEPSPGL